MKSERKKLKKSLTCTYYVNHELVVKLHSNTNIFSSCDFQIFKGHAQNEVESSVLPKANKTSFRFETHLKLYPQNLILSSHACI